MNKFAKDSGKLKRFCNPPWGVDFKVRRRVRLVGSGGKQRERGMERLMHLCFSLLRSDSGVEQWDEQI